MGKLKDYTGNRYGRLVAISFVELKNHKTYWKCKCDCGKIIIKPISYLTSGNCKSCVCLNREKSKERLTKIKEIGNSKSLKDYSNKKFGRLTVLYRVENNKFNQVQWLCKCECGNEKIITANSLRNGTTKSCGCLKKEQDYINIAHIKHNKSNTRLYNIWRHMKYRCNNPNGKRHKFYYDKGIKVCEEWKNSFQVFYNWAINNGYNDNLSIDRIDNNKGYYPNNCRWANSIQQNNNQSNNIKILYKGKEYSIKELAEQNNIKRATLYERIKRGWTIEKAITVPVKKVD